MAQHVITSDANGKLELDGDLLIHRYPEGDVDVVSRDNAEQLLIPTLYDEYQMSDTIKDGDEFVLDGKVIARCEGIHVIAC